MTGSAARIIAFANQKGGVAKTTSTVSIGAALSELGRRVLLIDLDPQASLTFSLGMDPDDLEHTIHDVLVGRIPFGKIINQREEADVAPSNIDLAGAEAYLLTRTGREFALRGALDDIMGYYDEILIDCPPSLGVLTLNALTAADEVVIPLQCEALSHRGVGMLLETIGDVRRLTNRGLKIGGVLPTMFDTRTKHARQILEDVGRRYGLPVLEPAIPKTVRFAEAPLRGRSILKHSSSHPGAAAYRAVARRLARMPSAPIDLDAPAATPPIEDRASVQITPTPSEANE
ncbi:MAG: ParA family protein [Actinomycetota bacterium]